MSVDLNQYKIIVDIFKGYMDTALTGTIWVYAVTGGVLTYYLGHRKENRYLKFSLILPFSLCAILAILTFKGILQADLLKGNVNTIGKEAGIPLETLDKEGVPPVKILVGFLQSISYLSTAICMGILFIFVQDIWPEGQWPKNKNKGKELTKKIDEKRKQLVELEGELEVEKKRLELMKVQSEIVTTQKKAEKLSSKK